MFSEEHMKNCKHMDTQCFHQCLNSSTSKFKQDLHSPNFYIQVVQLSRYSVDPTLVEQQFFAKKHVKKLLRLDLVKT